MIRPPYGVFQLTIFTKMFLFLNLKSFYFYKNMNNKIGSKS